MLSRLESRNCRLAHAEQAAQLCLRNTMVRTVFDQSKRNHSCRRSCFPLNAKLRIQKLICQNVF